MQTNIYYLDEFPHAVRALKNAAPDARWVYTPRGFPSVYPLDVAASWNKGDSLLVLEGDIAPAPKDIQMFAECDQDWCVAPYPLGTKRTLCYFGYGAVKFSARLQASFPYSKVLAHGRRGSNCLICRAILRDGGDHRCRDCFDTMCHFHQDTAFWHEMIIASNNMDIKPHVHPPVQHDHLGERALVGQRGGVWFWERGAVGATEAEKRDARRKATQAR